MMDNYERRNRYGVTPAICAKNIRGVMFVMCASPSTIAAALGCSIQEAQAFQGNARDDFEMTMFALRQAKGRMGAQPA